MSKVRNINTRKTSFKFFCSFYCWLWTYFTHFCIVSIVDFEMLAGFTQKVYKECCLLLYSTKWYLTVLLLSHSFFENGVCFWCLWLLSRHIKLNHTNIELLLQEAKQKYQKLTDYRTKCCCLSLLFLLLIATCASFAFLNGRLRLHI